MKTRLEQSESACVDRASPKSGSLYKKQLKKLKCLRLSKDYAYFSYAYYAQTKYAYARRSIWYNA